MPENYLENFESEMLLKIQSNRQQRKKSRTYIQTWWMMGISVAAILVVGLFLFVNHESNSFQTNESFAGWDEYAVFDEEWIEEELALAEPVDQVDEMEITYILDEGVTNDEIIEIINETP